MRILLCFVFFLSGVAGLVFEALWFRNNSFNGGAFIGDIYEVIGVQAALSNSDANAIGAGLAEKREGTNPVQQQVDPKQAEQHRDFKMQGDAAGPKSRDTQPKSGG